MQSTITTTEAETKIEAETRTAGREGAASCASVPERPAHFWAEYRARRGERVPRADLRLAIALAGEPFCRRALASEVPFGRSCAEEARGTRGELREALVRLAISGGRPVARELARQRVGQLGEQARAMAVEEPQLDAALHRVGADAAGRVVGGRVGFRKAALFEAALHVDDPARSEAWVVLAAAGVGPVRARLRRPVGERSAARTDAPVDCPRAGTELMASVGEASGLSPFGAELAKAFAHAA